jgi:hypothetical protein
MRRLLPLVLVWLALAFVLLAACGTEPVEEPGTPPATASPVASLSATPALDRSRIDPDQITAVLAPTTTLAEAAAQLAAALDVPVDQVRLRLERSGCSWCDAQAGSADESLAGLPVMAASGRIKAHDRFWLFVADLTCYYQYDGVRYTPQSCQWAPL